MMEKYFNDTGVCIPEEHFMVDISAKISQILALIERGSYFTMNRPRQYGKTTMSFEIFDFLHKNPEYLPIKISFEGIGDSIFEDEQRFSSGFLEIIAKRLKHTNPESVSFFEENAAKTTGLKALSGMISTFIKTQDRKVVLMIDEVDKSSNNQLFLSFIGMLRDSYLLRYEGEPTFHSVILIGVHDVKHLKRKISPESSGKLNSPWNIAIDFKVDMSFSPQEIETMLLDYIKTKNIGMDIPAIAQKIYDYTSGYPYLVSKLCKFVDEDIFPPQNKENWDLEDIEAGFGMLTNGGYTTTLFDSLFKYLEDYPDLYELIFHLVINGKEYEYNLNDPMIDLAVTYGIIKNQNGSCQIHNRIFEQRIYAYFLSRQATRRGQSYPIIEEKEAFIKNNQINLQVVLQKFQAFMREEYGSRDEAFLEREGRLLFLAYLRPIINGEGFTFKEPVVGKERRIDVVLTFGNKRHVIELKRWEGESYHQQGLQQLSDYLDLYKLKEGYLVIYDFRKSKEYKEAWISFQNKKIFAVWI
ncbi:MAG: AAA-like domain-containing protein [Microscillaceae bacterium]|nr:AAA-like domain-containing protein [Microscillaceae bacterium]